MIRDCFIDPGQAGIPREPLTCVVGLEYSSQTVAAAQSCHFDFRCGHPEDGSRSESIMAAFILRTETGTFVFPSRPASGATR